MTITWSPIFDSIAEQDFAIADDFLPETVYHSLKHFFFEQLENDKLKKAGIGASGDYQVNRGIRGDSIFWLDPSKNQQLVLPFFALADELKLALNREFFLSLSGYEFHFAHYPKGAFYKKHSDQFAERNNRLITVIIYFNDDWKPDDGGELKMFLPKGEKLVSPIGNRLVIFRSEKIEHEVLLTNADRYSLTGWMLYQPPGLTFL